MFLAAELNPFYLKVRSLTDAAAHLLLFAYYTGQTLLWMEPDHPFVIARLAGVFLCALPAVRELYQYVNDPRCVDICSDDRPHSCIASPSRAHPPLGRRAVRMGQHVWLLLATIGTELLAITKWSKGQFPAPLPTTVKWAWAFGACVLILYPAIQVSLLAHRSTVPFP